MADSTQTHESENLRSPAFDDRKTKPLQKPSFQHRDPSSPPPSTFRILLGVLFFIGFSSLVFKYLLTGQDVQFGEIFTSISKCNCDPGKANANRPTGDHSEPEADMEMEREECGGHSEPEADMEMEMEECGGPLCCIPQTQFDTMVHNLENLAAAVMAGERRAGELEAELEGYRPSYKNELNVKNGQHEHLAVPAREEL